MVATYQVIGACLVNVPIDTPHGAQLAMFHQHAILPQGVPADRIKHLLSVGLIKEISVPGEPAQPPAGQTADPAGEQGSDAKTVNARSPKGDLVDYGVAQGGNRDELEALTHKELQARYLKAPQQ